jgi:aspartate/methionine/tyrosine aminotransferase
VQVAAPALIARAAELRAPIAERVRANLAHLRAALAGSAGTVLDVEGGWSAVVQVPATRSEEAWAAHLLEREGVLVHPGFFFDFPGEAFLVVSLLTPPAAFHEGIVRLRAML